MTCEHKNFDANVGVARIDEGKGAGLEGLMAEVEIRCTDCGEAMMFRGSPVGIGWDRPHVDVSGKKLHAPIVPESEDPSFGMGLTGLAMRVHEGEQGRHN